MTDLHRQPRPGFPTVEWIDGHLARWSFYSSDPAQQEHEFQYWKGWFGYDEKDRPERIEGSRWWVRSSLKRAQRTTK